MKKLMQTEKGFTVMEVVISLTILMIVIAGVSGLISIVLKSKDFAERKQTATLLGQEILEEIKLIDQLNKNLEGRYVIELVDEADLVNLSGDVTGSYEGTIKGLAVNYTLNKSITNDTLSASLAESSETELNLYLKTENDNILISTVDDFTTSQSIAPSTSLDIIYENNEFIIGSETYPNYGVSKLTLNFLESYQRDGNLNVNVLNRDSLAQLVIQIKKHVNSQTSLDFSPTGNVKVINNQWIGLKPTQELYEFTLEISQGNKLLFEIYGTQYFSTNN